MKKVLLLASSIVLVLFSVMVYSQAQTDSFTTSAGPLKLTLIGHGSLMFEFKGKVIHVDPYGKAGDYTGLPKADLVLITHEHSDHLDAATLEKLTKEGSEIVLTKICQEKLKKGTVMNNGDVKTVMGLKIEAVPAYNLVNMRKDGKPYHPKGDGNGYVVTFGDKRFYIAGDTENVPEMKNLGKAYCAFIPMNLPFTMTPEMTADAAKTIKPSVLYPYHFGETDTSKIVSLLAGEKGMDVRIRNMK